MTQNCKASKDLEALLEFLDLDLVHPIFTLSFQTVEVKSIKRETCSLRSMIFPFYD